MAKFAPPSPLDFGKPQAWSEWKQRFLRYRIATRLKDDEGPVQVNTLIYAMGADAESAFRTFSFSTEAEKDDFDVVLRKYDDYFAPKRNVIHERAMFNSRNQHPGENAEAYIRALYELAETCEFGAQRDENIRDRIVTGLIDKDLSKELQLKSDLTLTVAIQTVKQSECVKSQMLAQAQAPANMDEVRKSTRFKKQKGQQRSKPKESGRPCRKCAYRHDGRPCPAKDRNCRKCGKPGHFAACCPDKQVPEVTHEHVTNDVELNVPLAVPSGMQPDHYTESPCDVFYLAEVSAEYRSTTESQPHPGLCEIREIPDTSDPWWVDLSIGGSSVKFKIDPGADVSVMAHETYKWLPNRPVLETVNAKLYGVSAPITCHGTFQAVTQHQGKQYRFKVYVADCVNNLLGRSAASDMNIVTLNVNEAESVPLKPFSKLQGPLTHIEVESNAEPYNVRAPHRVPFPLLDPLREMLDKMEKTDVIVKETQPTDWCAPIVVAPKKSGGLRVCVDLRKLNRSVKREKFVLPTFDDVATKLKGCKVFSKLDAASGYHQLPLDDESSLLTTFITPFGRYRFKRLPFGITSASEIFQRRMSELLEGLDGVAVSQDDIVIGGENVKQHDQRLNNVLAILKAAGLELNWSKCVIRVNKLEFLGHFFSAEGISAAPSKVAAIVDMPAPKNVTELRRILGMANWLGAFVPHMATVIQPLNILLKADVEWIWDHGQDQAFQQMKQMLISSPVLEYYDPNKPTTVAADASSYGLGAVLLQLHGDKLKPVAYASRSLTECERRYAQIEKELLALVWACEKFRRFLIGLPHVKLVTDHKPLVPIINTKDLNTVPIRCQRMLMRLMQFTCTAEYVPGKSLTVPDTLSRSPLGEEAFDICEIDQYMNYVPVSDAIVQRVQQATAHDQVFQSAIKLTIEGWPQHVRDVPEDLRRFHSDRAHLSVSQGLLLYDSRLVIPDTMRGEILEKIHEGHMGITKCRSRAQQTVWWPGISSDIAGKVESCAFCQEHRSTQRSEPMISTPLPENPWERIAADLCYHSGEHYLVITDYYSRWIELLHMPQTTSHAVIFKLKAVFARLGIPVELVSDNGPQFSSQEFKQFANDYGFNAITSSPRYAQSNGAAERAVHIAKDILDQPEPIKALMIYRATPVTTTGYSPAQLVIGRNIRTNLPMPCQTLQPRWPPRVEVRQRDEQYKTRSEQQYDRRHGAHPLPPLQPGDTVRVKDDTQSKWSSPGKVIGVSSTPRSYQVQTHRGTLRRNRRHLLLIPGTTQAEQPSKSVQVTEPSRTPVTAAPNSDIPVSKDTPASDINPEPIRVITTTRSGRHIRPPEVLNL